MTDPAPFSTRLRDAMSDAGIASAAELERRWVDRFGGTPANVHRQVMRLLNATQHPHDETAAKLAALTGKPADYFTEGLRPPARVRLGDLQDRLAQVAGLAAANEAAVQGLLSASESRGTQIEDLAARVEDTTGEVEALRASLRELDRALGERLRDLESRVIALEQ